MYSPEIIYKPVFKCSNCHAYVNRIDMECPNCGCSFADFEKKAGVIVDNIWSDAEGHFTLGNPTYSAIKELGISIKESMSSMVSSVADGLKPQISQSPSQVSITQDASTYDGISKSMASININSQTNIRRMNDNLGLGYQLSDLSEREIEKWKWSMKTIARAGIPKSYGNIFSDKLGDILLGAMIAKEQFGMDFDGLSPFPGRFGMSELMPHHFGLKSWKIRLSKFRESEWQYFIHSGVEKLNGTTGNAIRILEDGVYVIIGVGEKIKMTNNTSYITGFEFTVDGRTKPIINANFNTMVNPACGLQDSIILQNKCWFKVRVRHELDIEPISPCLLGVTYLPESYLRSDSWWPDCVITTT